MKRRVLTLILVLALCVGLAVPSLAESSYIWDTSSEAQELAKNRIDTSWDTVVDIDGLYDIGYVKYDEYDYATVCYCDFPARVTLLTTCNVMDLGGSMVRYHFDEGWLDSAGTVEPTYLVPVESEDFGTIYGEGTYWELDEGIYFMFSVNASKTLFIVVGDRLGRAVTDGENAYYYDEDTMTLSLKCWQSDAVLRNTICAYVDGVRPSIVESVKYWMDYNSSVMTNLYYAESGAVIYPAADAIIEGDDIYSYGLNRYSFRYITYTEVELAENAYGELYATKADDAASYTVSEAAVLPDGLYEVTVTCCQTSETPGDNGGAIYPVLTFYLAVGDNAEDAEGASFTDVTTEDWFYAPVSWAVNEGVTTGMDANTFGPYITCSQAHILTFLWRAAGEPEPAVSNPYGSAVNTAEYYYKPLLWAWEMGLISDSTIDPANACSRSDVVTYLWKLSGSPKTGSSSFTDVPANASYADAVAWAVQEGITTGMDQYTFSPDTTCTRGQIVTFLYRFFA